MKIQEVIKDRLDALDSQSRNTSSLTTNTAREIVEETMKYYTLCKDKESKYIGKNMNVGFVTGFTAVPTLGASAPVGIGTMAYNTFMGSKWEELKERSKEIGRRAATHAGMEFTKQSSGGWAFIRGLTFGGLDDAFEE